VSTQQTPLLKRLMIGSVLSGLLLGFGGFVTNVSAAPVHPVQSSIQHPVGPVAMHPVSPVAFQRHGPPPPYNRHYNDHDNNYRYNQSRRYWERYDQNRNGWYRYDREHNRFY
jgi:hypothetical protein